MTFVRAQQLGGHSIVWAVWLRVKPEPSHSEPFSGKYPLVAVSVSTRRRQEADFRRDGPAGQSQLAAISGETRSRPRTVTGQRQLSGESIDPGRNASFGRPDQRPSTRFADLAESTSTTWVWRPRSCMSALVSDVRRGSGGEADPGRAPCGQRCVVGVMACMAGRVRTQTAELNRRIQGMRCSCIHGQRARRRMKRQSDAVAAKAAVEPMAWLRVARPPLAGGAAHRTSPPRGGPLNGRSPARSRAAECGATTLPAMQQNAHHPSRRARCTCRARRLASHRPGLRQAAHASVGAGLATSCPEQTGRRSTTGWPLGAPVRSSWAARGASGGGWAQPVPGLSGAPAVTTSRAALLRAHPRSDTSSTLPAYKGHCFARCADHP